MTSPDSIKPGRYRHFKGNDYEVIGLARNSESMQPMVVYRALYGEGGLWVRPAEMFSEIVERDGAQVSRFEFIGEDNVQGESTQDDHSAPFRRVVTGHDDAGESIVVSDAPPERVQKIGEGGPIFYEIWNTRESPARIDRRSGEPSETGLVLTPPTNGTRIRVLDIPPDSDAIRNMDAQTAQAHFAAIGAAHASTHKAAAKAPHPFMHRTETIDYGIVLEGELVLILDRDETPVRAGDIIVQRGTNHAWANRSGRNCRIAFVLIDGEFSLRRKTDR